MANQSLAKVIPIDPEFAAVYAESASTDMPRSAQPVSNSSSVEEPEDSLITLKRMAEERAKTARKRSECQPGFDEVENDVSNVIGTAWDFITRPL